MKYRRACKDCLHLHVDIWTKLKEVIFTFYLLRLATTRNMRYFYLDILDQKTEMKCDIVLVIQIRSIAMIPYVFHVLQCYIVYCREKYSANLRSVEEIALGVRA